ncbi:hypothetical protein BU23DRAFT_649967 [Bimuria novae-zelandiae CBS 107.79]|uniref:Aminoglycoside phosphotransferase domain-containing protein n=1 Tax=Bimuria novae-zelandiae CBS 107.79 TaxID=1447943 RepID=A0A6A5UYY9_9PLEO|nr:hypothetical protein BU23DRAFT_649967 [Bimuria novae-zelandiae CBS 107.79]
MFRGHNKCKEIVVSSQRTGSPSGEFYRYLKGSFNLSLVIKFNDDGAKGVIRFPKPGHTATHLRDEKTTIPVLRVSSWGLTVDSPQRLGPFIIMDFVEGTTLTTLLKQPTETEQDEVILATDVDDEKLDYVYEQLADYMLQLSRLNFPKIGALAKDPTANKWIVSERPLTYNMNELVTVVSKYSTSGWPTAPFASARHFLASLADEHLVHLEAQRNLANSPSDAKRRFVARQNFKKLPTNMLADPKTLRITAVLDWEFTNAMPAQFAYDPPWWLLLLGPDMWLENYLMEKFMVRYEPRLEQFLRALERVEARATQDGDSNGSLLSARMRESWKTKRFWFDYGIRKGFEVTGEERLDDELSEQMEKLVIRKMDQLKAYDAECKARFS